MAWSIAPECGPRAFVDAGSGAVQCVLTETHPNVAMVLVGTHKCRDRGNPDGINP
jgi:hypothetical protein